MVTGGLTTKDWQLVEKAESTHPSDFFNILQMIEEAESDRAKELLRNIKNRKYHLDEAGCGLM